MKKTFNAIDKIADNLANILIFIILTGLILYGITTVNFNWRKAIVKEAVKEALAEEGK